MVKKTWDCNIKEDKPAEASSTRAKNNRLYLKTPKKTATPKTFQIDVLGKGIKNTAGIATIIKRKAENNMGGTSSKPIFITGKFTPHMIMTKIARI